MAVPISKVVLPPTNNIAKELDEIYKHLHELDFISIEEVGLNNKTLEKKESLQKEKQISIDPISLRDSSMGEVSFNMMLPPIDAPPDDCAVTLPLPLLLPAKHKFLSCSLPNSATSSPRFAARKKNMRNETQAASPRKVEKSVHKESLANTQHLDQDQEQVLFWRSKSCGEGRACPPPEELDELWLHNAKALQHKNKLKLRDHGSLIPNINNDNPRKSSKKGEGDEDEDDFKCSALCLFLPGFSKVSKPVRPRKAESMVKENNVISRTVSLEKFECGSWASSTIIPDHDDDIDSINNLYFDLPLELIKNLGSSDAHLPVSAAFVFHKDIKGVLKHGSASTRASVAGAGAGAGRKSHESSRHVRFSTSSPTSYPASPSCITPRLRKAREDFNAFLEAQSA